MIILITKLGVFQIFEPHNFLLIESEIEVDVSPKKFPNDTMQAHLQWEALQKMTYEKGLMDFVYYESFLGANEVQSYLHTFDKNTTTPYQFLQQLNQFIFSEFTYIKGVTTIDTTLDEVWRMKSGVCQDFAHFMLQATKMMGIPARYVSGYLCPYDTFLQGQGATHAWIEAYIPNYGWLGFDPTNNMIAKEHYVRLAIGRNYHDCSPVNGVFRGNVQTTLEVKVSVDTLQKSFLKQNNGNIKSNHSQKNLNISQQQQQ